jgi:hypothetical protein
MSNESTVQLDAALIARIDEARGTVSRAVWVTRACERDLATSRGGLSELRSGT